MGETNNIGIQLPPVVATNPIVQLLEDALARAKAGQITSLALVAINPHRAITPFVVGPQLCELHTGSCILAQIALGQMTNPQSQSKIMRVQG